MMALENNYFHLLGLPQQYAVDLVALESAWKRVQRQVHPDRFVRHSEQEKRQAVQWASQANEAYRVLKNPLTRALYWCELHQVALNLETHTQMQPSFLMQQMEWREEMQEALEQHNEKRLLSLQSEVSARIQQTTQTLEHAFQSEKISENVPDQIREWMFLEKFFQEISNSLEALPTRAEKG